MNRKEIITELKKYFDIRELVCRHVFHAFGEKAWQFFDMQALETLLVLRTEVYKKPMTINNWHLNGIYSQRGLRCNICDIAEEKTKAGEIYMSSHCNGAGFDHDVKGQTAAESRQQVINSAHLLPYRVRLEKNVGWVHLDIYDDINSTDKVTLF